MDMCYVLLFFNLLNAYVIFDFMDKMYERRYPQKRVYFFAYILFVVLHLAVNMIRIVPLNFAYEIFCICIFSYFLYYDISKKYLYNFLFAIYLIFVDQGSISIYSVIKSQSIFRSFENAFHILIAGSIDYSIVFLTYRLFISVLKRGFIDIVFFKQNIVFITLVLLEIVILTYFTQATQIRIEYFGKILLVIVLSFLCLDLYIIYLFKFVAKHNALKNEINLSQQQTIMLNNNINDIENKYKQSRKIIHDVRNYLQILKELYRQGEPVAAEKYAEQLSAKLNELEYRFQCDNRVLNILINDKLMMAKAKEIAMRVKIENLQWSFMKEIDLTTLFANLLNNAIEACENLVEEKRFVEIRICEINNNAVIRISNSYSSNYLLKRGEKFLSTKQGHSGIGMGNVNSVIKKYDGNIKFEISKNIFMVKIILPINVDKKS